MKKINAMCMTPEELLELLQNSLDDAGLELLAGSNNSNYSAISDMQFLDGSEIDERIAKEFNLYSCIHFVASEYGQETVYIVDTSEEGKAFDEKLVKDAEEAGGDTDLEILRAKAVSRMARKEGFDQKWEALNAKYGDRYGLSEKEHRAFISEAFALYEEEGFSDTYRSIDTSGSFPGRTGESFSVVGRTSEMDADLEVLPMWEIEFEDGEKTMAFPEEICPRAIKLSANNF